ncbi:MAG: hypothetical protein KDD89_01275 [Anaerolineales bacterium]|nr:hypothetical protein [Anaerolineales bacterium]
MSLTTQDMPQPNPWPEPKTVEWPLLAQYLAGLRPAVREAVHLAAIPLWFNQELFAWLWQNAHRQKEPAWWPTPTRSAPQEELPYTARNLYLTLRHTALVESTKWGGWRLKTQERQLILRHVWANDLPRFRYLNEQAGLYAQRQENQQGQWPTAVQYHQLLAHPEKETDPFKVELLNGFQHEQKEWIANLLPPLNTAVSAECLSGRAAAWVHCGQAWLHAEKRELEPARQAYQQAIAAPEADLLLQAGCTLALAELYLPPYDGRVAEAEKLVQQAQGLYREMGNWSGLGNCYHIAADIARLKGDTAVAQSTYDQACRIYRRAGARTQAAHCLHDAALLHIDLAEHTSAHQKFTAARHIYYRTGRLTPWLAPLILRAHYLKDEALSAFHLGNYQQAQDKIFAALVLYDSQQAQIDQPLWSKGRAFELLGQIEQKRQEWREAARWYREASAQYRLGEFTGDLARLLGRQAEIARAQDNGTRAIAQLEQAAKLQRQLGAYDEEARLYLQAATTAEANYDDERTLNYLNEARHRYVTSGNRLQIVECDWRLGQFYERTEAPHTAEPWYEQALDEATTIYDLLGQGHARRKLAWLALQQDDLATAREHYEQAAHCYQHLPDWVGLGYVLLGQGWLAWADGSAHTAEQWWQEAYLLARRHHAVHLQAQVLLAQAETALATNQHTTARRKLREAETVAQREQDQWQLAFVYLLWARLARQLARYDVAQTHLHWGWEAAEMAHAPLAQAELLLEQARLAQAQADMNTAVKWLARAHAQFDQLELDRGAVACRVLGAKLAWQRGERASAVAQMQQALLYYEAIAHQPLQGDLHHWLETHCLAVNTAVVLS